MKVSDIISRVRRTMGDDGAAEFADSDIVTWINEAQRELVTNLDLLQVKATTPVTVGLPNYALPSDMQTIHSIKWKGNSLENVSLEEAEQLVPNKDDATNYPTGTPSHYWIWGNQLYLYPAPDTAGDLISAYYNRMPVDVVNTTDTPELPSIYHNRILEYCIAQAYEQDSNLFSYDIRMQMFQSNVANMKNQSEWENQDLYPFISSSSDDAQNTVLPYYA